MLVCGSIFVRQHDGDGGLRVVYVERAASGNQLYKAGRAVVVADIQGDGQAVATWAGADDRKARKPYDIPYAELGIRDVIPSK